LKKWLITAHCAYPGDDAVEAGVAEDLDAISCHAEAFQPASILGRDRCGPGYGLVAGLQQTADRPTKSAAAGTHGCRNDHHFGATGCRPGGKLRPYIQLGENQEIGFQFT
jgi:hypothetical protein